MRLCYTEIGHGYGITSCKDEGEKVCQSQPSRRIRLLLGGGASLSPLHRQAVSRTPQKLVPTPLQGSSHLIPLFTSLYSHLIPLNPVCVSL